MVKLNPKVALVVLASKFESGGERGLKLLGSAKENLEGSGLVVKAYPEIVWDSLDAFKAIDYFSQEEMDLLILLHATWVCDSLQYIFVNNLRFPTLLWGVPYTETFSIGCVQHFGSILYGQNISFRCVWGLPEDDCLIPQIYDYALTCAIFRNLKNSRIALLGPRQTWRVAASQDMTYEEWEFSKIFGATIIHLEMDELLKCAEKRNRREAVEVLKEMKMSGRLGSVKLNEERLIYAAGLYLGVKEIFEKYGLTGIAAECYPLYSGLLNLPSSWLADEGFVVDTEGDIGHTMIMSLLNLINPDTPAALAEIGNISENCFCLSHEGSSAHSLAESTDKVCIFPLGENGTFVGFPLKVMETVTVLNLCRRKGTYGLLLAEGSTLNVSEEEWTAAGNKFLARVRLNLDSYEAFEQMIALGIDHHLVLKEGQYSLYLKYLCDLLGIDSISLSSEERGGN